MTVISPPEAVLTPHSSWYIDPERLKLEEERLFLKQWHFMCPASSLGAPGAVFCQTLINRPILVRRSEDGAVRAFHNVCRHRGGPLVPEGASKCRYLSCAYHGWRYDDCGNLAATPGFSDEKSPPIDYADYPLYPIAVQEWKGLVFVSFDREAPPLESTIGDLPAVIGDFDASNYREIDRQRVRIKCNWKVYVENWLESYHLPFVHKGLVGDVSVSDYEVAVRDRVVEHVTTRKSDDSIYGGTWLWLAPNLSWNFYAHGLGLEQMLPLGHGEMEIRYTFLFQPDTPEAELADALGMCETVTQEDAGVCETVQTNMENGVYIRGPLSPRHETGVAYFHRIIDEMLENGLLPAGDDRTV